mmetsp:Transcript_27303/g.71420  ORF Transcript_27303/g.71420 Transcript_27303/m.71420 type:complete len:321 (+) Transcript_27303:349-1311(+)
MQQRLARTFLLLNIPRRHNRPPLIDTSAIWDCGHPSVRGCQRRCVLLQCVKRRGPHELTGKMCSAHLYWLTRAKSGRAMTSAVFRQPTTTAMTVHRCWKFSVSALKRPSSFITCRMQDMVVGFSPFCAMRAAVNAQLCGNMVAKAHAHPASSPDVNLDAKGERAPFVARSICFCTWGPRVRPPPVAKPSRKKVHRIPGMILRRTNSAMPPFNGGAMPKCFQVPLMAMAYIADCAGTLVMPHATGAWTAIVAGECLSMANFISRKRASCANFRPKLGTMLLRTIASLAVALHGGSAPADRFTAWGIVRSTVTAAMGSEAPA